MENYIVSARKYRPSTFESVVGQRALTTTLKNAIATGKLAHAYLFCGPRGVGKTTCARIFAKTINCMSPTADGEACNQCESCTAFNEQRSYNIHELDAASNNSVDDIRQLVEQVRIPPQIGKYKVFLSVYKIIIRNHIFQMGFIRYASRIYTVIERQFCFFPEIHSYIYLGQLFPVSVIAPFKLGDIFTV